MGRQCQVNNLKIRYSALYNKWQVITPDKRVLEEFRYLHDAKIFAQQTKDFLKASQV